jgi:bacterioferritin-associated ferredoxin
MGSVIQVIDIEVTVPAREKLRLRLEVETDGRILSGEFTGVGCRETLELMRDLRQHLNGYLLRDIALPKGKSHSAMLFRELILRAQGRWQFPYKDKELCHCRAVTTAKVDAAIIGGCHTVERVRAATSANTACGACRTDIENVMAYRLRES